MVVRGIFDPPYHAGSSSLTSGPEGRRGPWAGHGRTKMGEMQPPPSSSSQGRWGDGGSREVPWGKAERGWERRWGVLRAEGRVCGSQPHCLSCSGWWGLYLPLPLSLPRDQEPLRAGLVLLLPEKELVWRLRRGLETREAGQVGEQKGRGRGPRVGEHQCELKAVAGQRLRPLHSASVHFVVYRIRFPLCS